MAIVCFTYTEVREGKLAEYQADNPVNHPQYSHPDFPNGVRVLTGDDIPPPPLRDDEQPAQ